MFVCASHSMAGTSLEDEVRKARAKLHQELDSQKKQDEAHEPECPHVG